MESHPIETKTLVAQMDRLTDALTASLLDNEQKRHSANGAVNSVVVAIQDGLEIQRGRIEMLERTTKETTETLIIVKEMAGVVSKLSDRMVGDDKMKSVGLVQEVEAVKGRVVEVEKKQVETDGKIKAVRYAVLSVAGLGALITWLQTTGFFQIFRSPS